MKKCPRCNRTYTDDTLLYCLEDGTRLNSADDPAATLVSPFPPEPTAPTVAFQAPAMPAQVAATAPASTAPAPVKRRWPLLVIGALVLAALAIGLMVGGFIFQRGDSPSSTAATPSPSPTPASVAATTMTPKPAATATPAPATPTPSSVATPSKSVVQSTPEPKPTCVLHNDQADRSGVRVRTDCDTQDCDNDSNTIAGEYADDTPVRVVKGANVRGARFTWVKVIIIDSGQTVWVASTKIKCE
jgi:hypothetical protein